ncbi:hypothetical protein [Agrobacterium pusense]|uniref:hypothetical protein n=1 Tax=Agrobacterium pusense TaxID=648995 RepID=UPI000884357B|nr:hypothetical protein [Agrobacterium pusense]OOO15801.1 hypothetical protein BTE56_22475 [Agrobacterium pusense]WKD47950.1 hypothetical protein M8C82_23615 [Agrobacterium pusense]SDF44361.1 hypothetical protein SAMN05421750_1134 [Agrobacterium pusense]
MITTAYVIDAKGLLVTRAGSSRLIPWTAIRFLHVHVTSGVGSTGFPVYSARLRMLFSSREISSLHWQGETRTDQSADYVRFMEELILFAIARNPHIRLRYGGDPMLEAAIPGVLFLVSLPFLFIPFLIIKPLGALVSGFKFFGLNKFGTRPVVAAIIAGLGVVLNMLPWSTGKQFKADDLPTAELPPKYRQAGVSPGMKQQLVP